MARSFKITLKDHENAPRTWRGKGYEFRRGETKTISNSADADYFDSQADFQVSEASAKPAPAAAVPKGRFSAKPAAAPDPDEEEMTVEGGEEEDDDEVEEEGEGEEDPELDGALKKGKKKKGQG